ncbi:hypothetical protein FACS1894137_06500 [Spirochaetia bacterium]|nr:hypothetical protein FACS1894137_06500 [Spirochaetia bacterium]
MKTTRGWSRLLLAAVSIFFSCATTGSSGEGVSLYEAIEQSAEEVAAELPQKTRVAIVAFSSEHENISNYLMDELTGALVDGSLEVADRRNLAYVYKELGFQMSNEVSDETAISIGKFLGASYVITGQLVKAGDRYRYRLAGINVETAVQESSTRLNVRSDRAFQSLLADARNAQLTMATADYGESTSAPPKTAGTFLDRGILFASRGDYEMAIADFSEAIQLNNTLASAYRLRGRALFGSVAEDVTIGENFSGIVFMLRKGNITNDQKAIYDRAIADFTQAIRLDPNDAGAYCERGNAYVDKQDYDRAIADYNQAIRLDPNHTFAYNNRGSAYDAKQDYDRAIADYNQAIRLDPNDASAYNNRGNAYLNKQDYDRAIADYNQAIRLDPNNALVYNNRGFAYFNKQDYDRAIADFNQAIRIDPNHTLAYNNRGNAYYNKGDYDRAIADFNQAIRIDPNDAGAYCERGEAYAGKQDYDRAIADFNQAIKLDPNDAYAYNNRGNAYYNKGDYDRAIVDYTKALNIDPNHAGAKEWLENARKARGR